LFPLLHLCVHTSFLFKLMVVCMKFVQVYESKYYLSFSRSVYFYQTTPGGNHVSVRLSTDAVCV
jgi:hypothetical protein